MLDKWKIIHQDKQARDKHCVCFCCKRFYCMYHKPHGHMLCSGVLPQWKWLYRLMREVSALDTCRKFEMHETYKKNLYRYQSMSGKIKE